MRVGVPRAAWTPGPTSSRQDRSLLSRGRASGGPPPRPAVVVARANPKGVAVAAEPRPPSAGRRALDSPDGEDVAASGGGGGGAGRQAVAPAAPASHISATAIQRGRSRPSPRSSGEPPVGTAGEADGYDETPSFVGQSDAAGETDNGQPGEVSRPQQAKAEGEGENADRALSEAVGNGCATIGPSWQASAWVQQQRVAHPFPRAFKGCPAEAERESAPPLGAQQAEGQTAPAEPQRCVLVRAEVFQASAWLSSKRQASPFPRSFVPHLSDPTADVQESEAPLPQTDGSSNITEPGPLSEVYVPEAEAENFSSVKDIIDSLRKAVGSRDAEIEGLRKQLSDAQGSLAESKAETRRARLAAMVFQLGQRVGRDLRFVKDAGSGAFADVAFALDAASDQQMAIKLSVTEENRSLLQREAAALSHLNGLPGSWAHVIQLLGPYSEFQVGLDENGPTTVGGLLLEKADCDLENYVVRKLKDSQPIQPREMHAVACAMDKWEESTSWLHKNGILHLDMKAENAVYFTGTSPEKASVKIIDLTGILTRRHILPPNDGRAAKDLRWKTTDLQSLNVPYVSTASYTQPEEAGLGPKFLDYSADWWSVGVSKMEILGLQPHLFQEDADTSALVYELLASGQLEALVTKELHAKMVGVGLQEGAVPALVTSILCNLKGSSSGAKLSTFVS